MRKREKITYKQAGVDYDLIDPLKVMAQKEGRKTARNLERIGLKEVKESRGEPAYVVDVGDFYIATVEECLGTKSLVADSMRKVTGKTYYGSIAQDTVAMMVSDISSVGARPVTILAYWAAGSDDWFADKQKMTNLVAGWRKACDLSGASWGGGETPTLSGIVIPDAVDLAGACVGIIRPKERLTLGDKLKSGDSIVLLESSGIHANGLSLARKIAQRLKKGYATKIADGSMYGEALLAPTIIYSRLIDDLFDKGIDIHYMANITGHGWRKLMRCRKSLTYRITAIPPVPPVLKFIQDQAGLDDKQAYETFNMGAGFAIYVSQKDVDKVITIANKHKIKAYIAGRVEKGEKQVIIEPKGIVYKGESLKLRG